MTMSRGRLLTAAVLSFLVLAAGGACRSDRAAAPSAPAHIGASAQTTSVAAGPLPPAPSDGFGGPVTVTFDAAPPLRVEVAARPDQRARGLMQRAELPAGTGMLFLFPAKSTGGFWMLGTLVPLSIAYVDSDRVVSVAEMAPCPPRETACPAYDAAGSYTAAVEAPGGFFTGNHIGAGAHMTIAGPTPAPG
jgi:uncharacterized membrane protein (UPF0127 family)